MRRHPFIAFSLLVAASCAAVSCSRQALRPAQEAAPAAVRDSEAYAGGVQAPKKKDANADHLDRAFFATNLSGDRLLSYSMSLHYRGKSLAEARRTLLDLFPRHGFLESETAAAGEGGQLSAVIKVRTARLLEALADLDRLGDLVSENLAAEDLTEEEAKRRIKARREEQRLLRRQGRATLTDADGRNAADVENALSQSEDRLDEAEFEAWRIRDRIQWTRISVAVSFPEAPGLVSIPPFQNLGVRLAGIGLWIAYGAAYAVPILLMVLLVLGGIAALLWFGLARFIVRWMEKAKKRS
ncbi:MAG: DUF4349 domain-containing protein [Spirochaetes bacterium]|nr:DUF4349 domain-containing protein [Spirochaetota bacterium]